MSFSAKVHLMPYPAAFIVEHAKRKGYAAGFIIGTVSSEEVIVTDFIPHTHKDTDVPSSKAYRAELIRRRAAKRRFTKQDVIGWYAAGQPSEVLTQAGYELWCNAPYIIFQNRTSLYLHCEMPHSDDAEPSIQWSAFTVSGRENGVVTTVPLEIVVGPMNSIASDVMLDHVMSLALYNGGHRNARSKLLNVDEVAYVASLDNKTSTDAVNEEQRKLQRAVTAAEQIVTGGSGGSKEAQEMMTAVEGFRAIREEALQRQRDQTGRVDFNSQQFKDALMIKCAATILRKEVAIIEMLSTVYGEDKDRRNNAEGGEEGAAKDQQQQQQQAAQAK